MTIHRVMGGAKGTGDRSRDQWITPRPLVASAEARFGRFALDVAASSTNSAGASHLGPGSSVPDALALSGAEWLTAARLAATQESIVIWCNPPFSALDGFLGRCRAAADAGATVVALAPTTPETEWWRIHVWGMTGPSGAAEVWWPSRRIRFLRPSPEDRAKRSSPSGATALLVYRQGWRGPPAHGLMDLGPDQQIVRWRRI